MICSRCGEEGWHKTVKRRDTGSVGILCDECYGPLADRVLIIPGEGTVCSYCEECKRYVNPTQIVPETSTPAGLSSRNVVSSGTCEGCHTLERAV